MLWERTPWGRRPCKLQKELSGEGGTPGPKEGLAQGRAQARGSWAHVSHRKQLEVGFGVWEFFKG